MKKLLGNIHWIIIAGALYNIGEYWKEAEDKLAGLSEQQATEREKLIKEKKVKKEIASFYKDIDEAKGRIERVAKEIEKSQQLLPSEISDTENIDLIRKMAEDVNVKELSIQPDRDEDRGFFIARKYKFRAKATYLQFLIMFEKIAENKRILNVSEISFKKLDQRQRSKFQLIDGEYLIEAYRYNSSFKEDRGIDKIESEFKEGKKMEKEAPKNKPRSKKGTEGEE